MKKKFIIIISIIIIIVFFTIISNLFSNTKKSYIYDSEKAIAYSYKYVDDRNPEFANFESNCTNYISQCLLAGNIKMDDIPAKPISDTKVIANTNKWFCYSFDVNPYKPIVYYMSSSFSRLDDFITYWSKTAKVPYNTIKNTKEERKDLRLKVNLGDILILHADKLSHCAIVVGIDENDIYYNSNTNDRIYYPLSSVNEDNYRKISYFNFVK